VNHVRGKNPDSDHEAQQDPSKGSSENIL